MKPSAETELFRSFLREAGIGGVESYSWHNDEPLYLGDPISGRINSHEFAAVKKMIRELNKWNKSEAP